MVVSDYDKLLLVLALVPLSMFVYGVVKEVRYRVGCRRRERLGRWQRRALMESGEDKRQGFAVIVPDHVAAEPTQTNDRRREASAADQQGTSGGNNPNA